METRFQLTTRCNNCAAELPIDGQISVTDKCRNCGNDLHTCRNCINFDPSARNECIKPIEVRVANKSENNLCTYFESKLLVEKKGVSAAARTRAESSRHQAFHDLFKK